MKLVKGFLLLIALFSILGTSAQIAPNRYWIQFSDKDNSPFSVNDPTDFLSQKSLARRKKQDISIQENDLPVNTIYIDQVLDKGAITLILRSKWLNGIAVEFSDSLLLDSIHSLPFVVEVEKVKRKGVYPEKPPTQIVAAPEKPESGNVVLAGFDYGLSAPQIEQIQLDFLHRKGFTGQGLTVAIMDGGFSGVDALPAFERLWINNQILGTRDFVHGGTEVFSLSSHGMRVLSVMGGWLPGELIGAAPDADYWLLRTEDVQSEFRIEEIYWVAAAEFADSVGVDIINTSLGYNYFDDTLQNYTHQDLDGISSFISRGHELAAEKGIILVTSAGNEGNDPWKKITVPGDARNILSVGAVTEDGDLAVFSSIGPTADGRIKPDVMAFGQQTVQASPTGGVFQVNGTSFASPIIAGAAACLWQTEPDSDYQEVMQAIRESSHLFDNPNNEFGYGIPNFIDAMNRLEDNSIELVEEEALEVFPNPALDQVRLEFLSPSDRLVRLRVTDLAGRLLLEETWDVQVGRNAFVLDLTSVAGGAYFVRVEGGEQVFSQVLIRQKN